MSELLTEHPPFSVNAWGITFTVYGDAAPGGSKTPGRSKNGKLFVRDSNPRAAAWKQQIAEVAGTLMQDRELFEGPLLLHLTFYRKRAKWHYNKKGVIPNAPKYPVVKPDLTKLIRPLEDALTGVVYKDDNQIVEQVARKRWADEPRVDVRIGVLT